jgi:hypothetical protein
MSPAGIAGIHAVSTLHLSAVWKTAVVVAWGEDMNVERMLETLDLIDRHTAAGTGRVDMDNWCEDPEPECGTIACLAGWVMTAEERRALLKPWHLRTEEDRKVNAEVIGWERFGIDEEQGDRLFFVGGWPDAFVDAYEDAETPVERARVLRERVEHFIATDGEE